MLEKAKKEDSDLDQDGSNVLAGQGEEASKRKTRFYVP